MKNKIGELLFQIIPVMIGVYLGFAVSDWSDNKKRKAQSKMLVENILSEIEFNEKRIKNVVDYHQMLRDSSDVYSNSIEKNQRPPYFKGTRVVKLTNSAYNTGNQTGIINELPMKQIQILNKLYTYQNDYNDFGNMLLNALVNKDFTKRNKEMGEVVRFLSVTMTDIVIKERDLLEGFKMVEMELKGSEDK